MQRSGVVDPDNALDSVRFGCRQQTKCGRVVIVEVRYRSQALGQRAGGVDSHRQDRARHVETRPWESASGTVRQRFGNGQLKLGPKLSRGADGENRPARAEEFLKL